MSAAKGPGADNRDGAASFGASAPLVDAAHYSVTETLRDGRKIVIRAQRPEDREGFRAALTRVSPDLLYHRFFTAKHGFSEQEVHYFLDIDFVNQVALVAIADENGDAALIGSCRYIVIGSGRAEASFTVIDEYEGLGVGTALMRHLAEIGRRAGLRELVAEVLSDNAAMLKVFERSGLAMSAKRDGAVTHVVLRYP